MAASQEPSLDPELLKLLACPRCDDRPALTQRGAFLVCPSCGYGYRVESGIPDLLPEHACPPEELRNP